jgi:hypothetical protein
MLMSCIQPAPRDLFGVWSGNAHGQDLTLELIMDGGCKLAFRNQETGEQRELKGRYVMDFTKRPVPLNIRGIKELPYGLHAIVDIRDDSTICISQFSTRWRLRPIAFEADKSITLHRAEASN